MQCISTIDPPNYAGIFNKFFNGEFRVWTSRFGRTNRIFMGIFLRKRKWKGKGKNRGWELNWIMKMMIGRRESTENVEFRLNKIYTNLSNLKNINGNGDKIKLTIRIKDETWLFQSWKRAVSIKKRTLQWKLVNFISMNERKLATTYVYTYLNSALKKIDNFNDQVKE